MPKAGDTRANAPAPSQPTTRERGNWGGVQDDGRDKGLPGGAAPVQADLGMMRGYTGLRDMVDRGGPGKAAPGGQFSGAGPISTAANFIAGGGILGLLGRGLAGLDGLRNPNYVPGTLPPEFQPGYRDNDGPSPQPQEEEEEAVTPTPTPTTPYVPPVRPPVEVPTMYEPYTGGLPTLAPTVDLGFPNMQGNFDPYYLAAMSGSPLGFQEGGSVSPIDRVLEIGRTALGMNENEQNAALRDYLATGGQNLDPATTAWCAAYVNATLNQAGLEGSGSLAARSFLDVGTPVDEPQPGDLAVFWRGSPDDWRGHVGFYQGMDPEGNILVLGGNQGDAVSVAPYPQERLLGYRRISADGSPVAVSQDATGDYTNVAPTSAGQDADPGVMGRIDQVVGGIFGLPGRLLGREEERSMDLDAQIADIQARVDAGEISQGAADSVIANLMLRGEDEGDSAAMGLLNISDYLMSTEPDFPSSLPTTVVRGSGGAGTSAIGRLGVRPLA